MRFGFEFNYVAKPTGNTGLANGYFQFHSDTTRQLSDRGQGSVDGNAVASLLSDCLTLPADRPDVAC